MKSLHTPQPCRVLLDRQLIRAVHFRERAWVVRETLCVYTLCDPWRRLPGLEGEKRVYYQLLTTHGQIEVFQRVRGAELGWFVARWWD
jgi:hypothetical protein